MAVQEGELFSLKVLFAKVELNWASQDCQRADN